MILLMELFWKAYPAYFDSYKNFDELKKDSIKLVSTIDEMEYINIIKDHSMPGFELKN